MHSDEDILAGVRTWDGIATLPPRRRVAVVVAVMKPWSLEDCGRARRLCEQSPPLRALWLGAMEALRQGGRPDPKGRAVRRRVA
jgi:hypothetical protein